MTLRSVIERTDHDDGTTSDLALVDERPTRDRIMITGVDVWSVVKLAVVFWTILAAFVIAALVVLWTILSATGAVTNFEHFVTDLTGVRHFQILSDTVLGAVAVAILVLTIVCIAVTVMIAVWFNTLSALVGGIEVNCVDVPYRRRVISPPERARTTD